MTSKRAVYAALCTSTIHALALNHCNMRYSRVLNQETHGTPRAWPWAGQSTYWSQRPVDFHATTANAYGTHVSFWAQTDTCVPQRERTLDLATNRNAPCSGAPIWYKDDFSHAICTRAPRWKRIQARSLESLPCLQVRDLPYRAFGYILESF